MFVGASFIAACGISKPHLAPGADAGADVSSDAAAPIADATTDVARPFEHPPLDADTPELVTYPKTGLSLPDGVRPPRRLLPASAELTGGGTVNTCSHQQPASGDGHRWCAFSTLAAGGSATELWVIDVTAAAATAGEIPACDGSSPSCKRLTGNLWTVFPLVGPGHPYAQSFDGDTLIFYADAISGKDEAHKGPIYAWRPGWPSARRLTTDQGFACRGHDNAAVVICIDQLDGDAVSPKTFTLRAGRLTPPDADNAPLPAVGTIAPLGASGFPDWQSSFSRTGDRLAVSSPDPVTGAQVLSVIATDAIGTAGPTPIITDARSWASSHDGSRVYFFRRPADDASPDDQLWDLYVADFPSGANATLVASSVHDYQLMGDSAADEGIVYLAQTDATEHRFSLVYVPPAATPGPSKAWFSYRGMLEDVLISRDRHIATWLSGGFIATAVRTETLESCVINNGDRAAFVLEELENAGLLFWTEDSTDGLYGRDGFVTPPDSCQPKLRFARGMYWYTPVGDRGLVFGDELGGFDRVVAMKYVAASNEGGAWHLGDPVRIDDGADPEFIVVDVATPLLIYVKNHSGTENGTYLFGPVPF